MIEYGMEFWSPTEKLPKIPFGKYFVDLILITFDKTYEEMNPGYGYEVFNGVYSKVNSRHLKRHPWYAQRNMKEDFMVLYLREGWGEYGPLLQDVLYWAYMPEMVSGRFV